MNEQEKVAGSVAKIYDTGGRDANGGVTGDAAAFEDLRPSAARYVSACRLRVLKHLPERGARLLDMASGPIQYPEYLKYSASFDKRVCVDLSRRALEIAQARLGSRGEYHLGDFLDLNIEEVDAAVSLHTIYHIHKDRQEDAVRKMIALTKPGGTIVIVYSNPGYFISVLAAPAKFLRALFQRRRKSSDTLNTIYFHRFALGWWRRFSDQGAVRILPWRTLGTREQRLLGEGVLSKLFLWEESFPGLFARIGLYPMIVIKKHD
jgi:SAM-dependent methyltransferase